MVQYTGVHQCNPLYKQNQRKKHIIISLDTEKAFDKKPFMFKSLGEIRDTRQLPKHNKCNTKQANRQHKYNGEKLKAIPLK